MIKILLKLLPIKTWVIVGFILSLASGVFGGYKITSNHYKTKELKAYKLAEKKRRQDERKIAELERAYLEAKRDREIIYRDRIKKVVKYIDRDTCTVTDDGLYIINQALRGENQ